MKKRYLMVCLLTLVMTIGTIYDISPALAQDSEPVEMEGVTVTATKTETDPDAVPFTVRSTDHKDIEIQPGYYMNNIGEFIRDLPGVHVAQYYPWGPPWIHLRGTGYFIGRTLYLIDGLPTHSFLSTAINPHDVQQMDVILGPSSALYGPNASGGAINVITRRGEKNIGAKAEIAYGSNNTFRPHASIGDHVNNWRYYLSYSGDYSDGYQMKPVDGMVELYDLGKKQYLREASLEDNEYENTYLAGKFNWENRNGVSFSLGTNYARRYLYGGQNNFILNDNGDQFITTAKLEIPLGNVGKLKVSAAHHYDDHPQQLTKGLFMEDGNVVLDDTITSIYDWTREITPMELQSDLYLGKNNILTTGVFWSREEEERHTKAWDTGDTTSHSYWTTDQAGFYLQDQHFLMDEKLILLGGIRYDHWKYHDIYDSGSTNQYPDSTSKEHTTYRGGIKYRFNRNIGLRASYGTAYWPGTALWFYQNVSTGSTWREANPDLEPEKTWMTDMGLDMNFPNTGTLFNITGYYGEIEDMVSYRYDENPYVEGGTIIRTQNMAGAEIYGLEIQLRQRIIENLWLTGALTLNHSRIQDDPANDGNQLRNAPDYHGSVGLRYLNTDIINAEVLYRFSDDRYYDDSNTDLPYFHMDAYETVDAKIWRDWHLSSDWILTTTLSGVNLSDEDYATEIVYVNPGRYIEGTMRVTYRF